MAHTERGVEVRQPEQLLMGEAIRLNARRFPNKLAVVFRDKRYSYAEFNSRINRLANALGKMGIKKGNKVAILAYNRNEYLEVIFAAAKIGVVFVPLHYALKGPEIEYIVNRSDSLVIFVEDELLSKVLEVRERLNIVKDVIVIGDGTAEGVKKYEDVLTSGSSEEPGVELSELDPLMLNFTSGTTGRPKGALRTHRAASLMSLLFAIEYDYRHNDLGLIAGPLYSAAGMYFCFPNLYIGASVYILHKFDALEILKIIDREKCNNAWLAPVMLRLILSIPEDVRKQYNVSSMHSIMSVGSPLHMETRKSVIEYFGNVLYDLYGAAEQGASCVIKPEDILRKPKSDGQDFLGMEMRVVDDKGNEVRRGGTGELIVRGFTIIEGYYKDPDTTRESFYGNFVALGDLGYQDEEGFYYLVDRKKDMIISGGTNVYPAECEEVMSEHPKIADVAVIGVPDEKWGEAVKALIILKPGEKTTENEIIMWCKKRMASYKVPKSVEFISEIPHNPSGKVMKYVLREKYWAGKERKIS